MANEKRLIDANTVSNGIGVYVATNAYLSDTALDAFGKVAKWLDEAPTVDAVEVVRCGKCEWYDPEGEYCKFWHGVRHPEHYCGEGKRKTNEETVTEGHA